MIYSWNWQLQYQTCLKTCRDASSRRLSGILKRGMNLCSNRLKKLFSVASNGVLMPFLQRIGDCLKQGVRPESSGVARAKEQEQEKEAEVDNEIVFLI